jgi:hypothetical protein
MIYSNHIYEIVAWLRRNGVRVHEYATDLPASGMYRSETKEIFLNEPDAFFALLTIAHEAGHWLGYLIDEKPESYQRERQAHVYGWYVLKWFDAPITRETWRMHCRGSHAFHKSTKVETEHLYRRPA